MCKISSKHSHLFGKNWQKSLKFLTHTVDTNPVCVAIHCDYHIQDGYVVLLFAAGFILLMDGHCHSGPSSVKNFTHASRMSSSPAAEYRQWRRTASVKQYITQHNRMS